MNSKVGGRQQRATWDGGSDELSSGRCGCTSPTSVYDHKNFGRMNLVSLNSRTLTFQHIERQGDPVAYTWPGM